MQTWFHLFVDDFYDRWANIKFPWRFTIAHIDCRQIFSINMKATGGSLVTLVSWLGSFAISYSFSFLMDWSSAGNCSPAILDVLFFLFGKRKNNVYEICLVRSKLSALLTEEAWNCNAVMYTSCLHFFIVYRYLLHVLFSQLDHCTLRGEAGPWNQRKDTRGDPGLTKHQKIVMNLLHTTE